MQVVAMGKKTFVTLKTPLWGGVLTIHHATLNLYFTTRGFTNFISLLLVRDIV